MQLMFKFSSSLGIRGTKPSLKEDSIFILFYNFYLSVIFVRNW